MLSLETDDDGAYRFRSVFSMESLLKPTKLHGDLLATSDDLYRTEVWNWKLRTSAILEHTHEDDERSQVESPWTLVLSFVFDIPTQNNRCVQVVFANRSILVVRARGIYLFPEPVLHDIPLVYHPIAEHSFGWIDGVSVTQRSSGNLSILLRGESDDPWASGFHSLNLFTLERNPEDELLPYLFPPILVSQVSARRGSLRCRRVILGKCGTAVWIQPQDRALIGLASFHHDHPHQAIRFVPGHETVVAAAFPGPLAPPKDEVDDSGVMQAQSRALCSNSLNNWSSLDYNEEEGRIVLSSGFGRVMVLEL